MANAMGAQDMTTITFVSPQGRRTYCTAAAGTSAMLAALVNGVDGILAECGGELACGTCHVYVEPAHWLWFAPPGPDELAMLDMTAAERRPHSRLSCQLLLTDAQDGLVLHLPQTQL